MVLENSYWPSQMASINIVEMAGPMDFELQTVNVANGHDESGLLLFRDNKLQAVLVHLSEDNEVAPGHWFLEAGFGNLHGTYPTFSDLDAAQKWIAEHSDRLV